ncbi:MAG: hypothetical protein LBR08_07070 [Bacteroidales bacterium]|jgi:hypothetical protein|nr:hypothetical protein [Bacteroidales bacterium]
MAKSNSNVLTHGLSGKIGNLLVFRQVGGKTIVTGKPKPSRTESDAQKQQRRRFQSATLYAKSATEEYVEAAKKKGKTPYIIAVADFLNAPSIEHVDVSGYTGASGDVIVVKVSDDFKVKWVHVNITNSDGSPVEEGEALPDAIGYEWRYTATQNNDNLSGDRILISISDTPGNIVTDETVL